MERYLLVKELGAGAFGSVRQAINQETGEVVAIKQIRRRFDSWEECLNLRENLYQIIADRKTLFSEAEVRGLCRQVFQGLAYMQKQGYFHRDLKPENLLVTGGVVKIADFGLARETNSRPPYTQYVSTRWYRAPEVILQSDFYNSKVDMWAMGAIMAELLTLRPLFPGTGEANQMHRICSVLGTPTMDTWAEGIHLARTINYQFPEFDHGVPLSALIPSASEDAISLISMLCSWNPCDRPTAEEALGSSFLQELLLYSSIPPLQGRRKNCRNKWRIRAGMANQHVSRPSRKFRFGLQSINMGRVDGPGVSDTDDILPHVTNGPSKQFPFKAEVHGIAESADMFIRPGHESHPATIYTRKVAV
ncbi:hypothetical protein OIU78_013256 [Salix suchowensis]|nr:hypothetical protein OIU78_013256 [Salix suchowensis]